MQGSKATSLLEGLQEIYKKKILPVESNFKFDSFHSPLLSENDINAKPMVLLLGQYSTGKTTFIQTLLGREYPGGRIGPEPTTDRFVAVMHGSQEKVIPGNAAAIQADKPFTGLARFGSSFLSKFQVSELPSQLLESITIVDTPGVLSGDKQRLGRAYDYPQVSRWFAEHADLILIFFDAHKLDISDELKDVLEILEPHEDKIRIVLNKADQVGRQELMRVYGALMWSLGKVIQTPEVPRVYISSFRTESQVAVENILMEEEKRDLIHELKQLPSNSATRRVNDLVKRARVAKVHAIIINYLRNQMPAMFGKSSKQTKLVDNLAQEFTKIQQEYRIPKGDFPDLEDYTAKLREIDLCNFPKLGSSKLVAIDEAIALDIPRLLQRYPPMFDQISIIETANPFVDSRNAVRMADKELLNRDRIDMVKSTKIFETLHPVNGKLSGRVCRQFFLQSGLSSETMAKLWALSDQDLDGYLDLNEFALMTYLVQLKLAGIEIPDTLPDRVTVEIYYMVNLGLLGQGLRDLEMSSGAAIFVMGPAGSGKSTFCSALIEYCEGMDRVAHLINLDPAAEHFDYSPSKDIRDLVVVEDVMEELQYGPNGGLIFCLEYLIENMEWLTMDLGEYQDEFLIIDCPELYTHSDIMPRIVDAFKVADYKPCAIYLLESLFLQDVSKFFAGVLTATSAMLQLGIPHLNVISKMDLLEVGRSKNEGDDEDEDELDVENELHHLHRYFYPDPSLLAENLSESTRPKFYELNRALVQLIDEYDMVSFIPLNIKKEASIENLMMHIEMATQYSEALEPKEPRAEDDDGDLANGDRQYSDVD